MIIVMKPGASRQQIDHVIGKIQEFGYKPHPIYGTDKTVIGAIGDERGKERVEALL
ncbi:MAG: 3-deoxy-7-phosphoheptulonate synthase, partial [Fibrobacterota bacterium]